MTRQKKSTNEPLTTIDEIRQLAAVENEASQVRRRVDDDGKPVQPSVDYFETVENLLSAYDPRALPFAERAMKDLRTAFDALMALEDEDYPDYRHGWSVAMQFWSARDAAQVKLSKNPPKPQSPELPSVLKGQGLNYRQIARCWQWLDENGEPDEDRVRRELDNPGSECTPAEIKKHEHIFLKRLGWIYTELVAEEVA